MRTSKALRAMAAAFLVAIASACSLGSETANIAITVKVTVDGTPREGRGVWNVTLTQYRGLGTAQPIEVLTRGEAIRLAGTNRPAVYLLRRGHTFSSLSFEDLPQACEGADPYGNPIKTLQEFQGPCRLVRGFPRLVTIEDPSDPRTIESLGSIGDQTRLDDCPHVCLVSIELERTNEPVTTGIVADLPWLGKGEAKSRVPNADKGKADAELLYVDFSTEIYGSLR